MNVRALSFAVALAFVGLGAIVYLLGPGSPEWEEFEREAVTPQSSSESARSEGTQNLIGSESTPGTLVGSAPEAPARVDVGIAETQAEGQDANLRESGRSAVSTVAGRLVDGSGRGVGGAYLRPGRGALGTVLVEGKSKSDGTFELAVPAGTTELRVVADGFALHHEPLTLLPGQESNLREVVLELGGVLEGVVLDANGAPLQGAELFLNKPGVAVSLAPVRFGPRGPADNKTDSLGRFRIGHAPTGDWQIQVVYPDRPLGTFEGQAVEPGSTVGDLVFQLERGADITGVVLGFVPGSRLQVVALAADSPEGPGAAGLRSFGRRRVAACEVSEDGSWRLQGIEVDQVVDLDLYESFGGQAPNSISEQSVQARAGDAGVALAYRPGWRLAMRVVDARSGEPVENFRLSFGPQFALQAAEPDTEPPFVDGRVRFSGLRMPSRVFFKGKPTGQIEAQGYAPHRLELPAQPGEDLLDLGRILLDPVPRITVRVTDRETGLPVVGALVNRKLTPSEGRPFDRSVRHNLRPSAGDSGQSSAVWTPGQSRTKSDGVAVLDGLPGRLAELIVSHPDFANSRVPSLALSDESLELGVELDRGGTVEVTVVDEKGRRVSMATVMSGPVHSQQASQAWLRSNNPLSGTMRVETNSQGIALFRQLSLGTHSFWLDEEPKQVASGFVIKTESNEGARAEVDVTGPEQIQVQLVARVQPEVQGRITQAGVPLAGASVFARDRASGDFSAYASLAMLGQEPGVLTDGDGRYRLAGLEPEDYILEIRHPSRALLFEVPFGLAGQDEQIDVDLPVNAIEGRVTDLGGQALVGVPVRAVLGGPALQAVLLNSKSGGTGPSGSSAAGASVVTDGDGRYRLQGLPLDRELLVIAEPPASLGSFVPTKSEPVRLSSKQTARDVDIVCPEGGRIRVTLDFGDGDPGRVLLVASETGGRRSRRTELVEGHTELLLEGLAVGSWKLSASLVGAPVSIDEAGTEVEVIAGKTVEVTLAP